MSQILTGGRSACPGMAARFGFADQGPQEEKAGDT
jgi:hypothetical protein